MYHLGYKSVENVAYDFTGNLTNLRESHKINASQTDVFETVNTYDTRSRLVSSASRLNGGTPATVLYTYDAVGRLVSRKLGAITETMTYNPRGWLTGKESVPFKMKLRYEKPEGGSTACWNGNISEWEWQQGTNAALMYGFTYDGINRLTETSQKQKSGTSWSPLPGNYLEKGLTYDRNGNIKTLQRTANGSVVDGMVYTYTGNQLTSLSRNGTIGTYQYDKNGNMINDSRKNLSLSYNVLNLLSTINTGATRTATYTYLADGTKLKVTDGSGNGICYLGSLTYVVNGSNKRLEGALFGDGRIIANSSSRVGDNTRYFLKDHLGSIRAIVDQNGTVKERNDYYPFGGRYAVAGGNVDAGSRWKYNGKEEQITGNLGWLDYGARMYDWELGRWFGGDPMQEEYFFVSPYSFCYNNSLSYVDINGMWIDDYQLMSDGRIVYLRHTEDKYDVLYASNTDKEWDINREKFEKIYDRSILPNLSKGKNSYGSSLAMTTSYIDATNLFLFVSENSMVEWSLMGFSSTFYKNGRTSFIMRTSHEEKFVRTPNQQYRYTDILFELHSHPGDKELYKLASGDPDIPGSGDRSRASSIYEAFRKANKKEVPNFFFYHTNSESLYRFTPTNSGILIKQVRTGQDLREVLMNKKNRTK